MDPKQSIDLLRSVRRPDQAAIFEGNTQRPFSIQKITLDLSTAVNEANAKKLGFAFKAIYVEETTDSSVEVSFKPNSNDSYQSALLLKQNDALNFDDTQASGFLYWDAQSGKSITLVFLVNAQFSSGKMVVQNAGGVSISEGTSFSTAPVTLGAAAATLIVASNADRTTANIQNNTGSPIWVGGSTVTNAGATLGYMVGPGASIEWRNSAALYGYSVAGGPVLVLEEEN
jgi:hypothetical protein